MTKRLKPYNPMLLRMQARRRAQWDTEFAGKSGEKIGSLEKLVRRVGAFWKGLTTFLFSAVGVASVLYILFLLWHAGTDQTITIAEISVPNVMVEKGYTPQVVAIQLRSAVNRLAEDARNANIRAVPLELAKSGSKADDGCGDFAEIKTKLASEIPNFVVPNTGLSVESIAGMIRDFEKIDNRSILSGEITIRAERPVLHLHLQQGGTIKDLSAVDEDPKLPDNFLLVGAEEVIEVTNPLLLALAFVKHDPRNAIRIVNSLIDKASRPSSDSTESENVSRPWFARLSPTRTGGRSGRQCTIEWAHILRANALWAMGEEDDALEEFRQDTALYPEDPQVFYLASIMLDGASKTGKSNWEEAIRDLDEAIKLDPRPPQYYAQKCLSKSLLAEHDKTKLDKAISECRAAVQHDPTFVKSRLYLAYLLEQKKLGDGLAEYKKAVELDPNDSDAHVNLGAALFNQKNLDGAIAEYKKAIELDPTNSATHNRLGTALFNQKNFDRAIAEYKKAIELDPTNSATHNRLGTALFNQKNFDRAIAEFKKAIELDPNNSDAYYNLGLAFVNQENFDGAIAEFKKAIELDPNNSDAHGNLGVALFNQKNIDGAIAEFKKAIELDPNNSNAHDNLGAAAGNLGNLAYQSLLIKEFEKSLDASDRAIAAAPSLVWLYSNRAHALMFLGRLDEARKLYQDHRGEEAQGKKMWEDVIRDDFDEMRRRGLTNPLMDEIEQKFAKTQ